MEPTLNKRQLRGNALAPGGNLRQPGENLLSPREGNAPQTGEFDPELVRGIVFDVHRFSLHDGPGIRTTVFLKGCPLSCLWCHNPESQAFRPQLSFDPSRCTECLDCAAVCPTGALTVSGESLVVRHDVCSACGACVDACPSGAFSIIGGERTVRDVLDEVERDRAYFDRSRGGLTVSGGEPLAQPHFTRALLEGARRRGLHTCLDTSGAVHPRRLQEVLPYTDLFLYDYKDTSAARHRMFTGVSNELILENLAYLYGKGARIILRCPVVPGANDSPDHLAAIAELAAAYPDLEGVQIMAYHNLGRGKASAIGIHNPMDDLPTADPVMQQAWLDRLHGLGCTRCELG